MPAETLLALICPEFALGDYERIQRWRRSHDAGRVDQLLPHFTLVFPVRGWKTGEFSPELRARREGQGPFEIVLDRAVSHSDAGSETVMDWLLPGVGREALSALQDRLYAGALAPERPAGPATRPHITIGRSTDAAASQARMAAIDESGLSMRCIAGAVQIVRFKGERVKRLDRIERGRER